MSLLTMGKPIRPVPTNPTCITSPVLSQPDRQSPRVFHQCQGVVRGHEDHARVDSGAVGEAGDQSDVLAEQVTGVMRDAVHVATGACDAAECEAVRGSVFEDFSQPNGVDPEGLSE
jgi:hypothetical protein